MLTPPSMRSGTLRYQEKKDQWDLKDPMEIQEILDSQAPEDLLDQLDTWDQQDHKDTQALRE